MKTVLDQTPVTLRAEVGSSMINIGRLLRVGRGGVIELNTIKNDPIELKVGNTVVAEGTIEVSGKKYVVRIDNLIYS